MDGAQMPGTPSAYEYPLLIKRLLFNPLVFHPDREIVYGGSLRHGYRTFRERVCRLASALRGLGVKAGDTVAVMDWDSHRYLECYFAVPMIGAVLHTVNVRLPPEQILYTINHAEDDVILVNADFLPLLEAVRGRIDTVRKIVLLRDGEAAPESTLEFAGEYEELLAAGQPSFDFPDFDEKSRATTFYTTGTTGMPKGVFFSHRQIVLHTLAILAAFGTPGSQGRFHQDDVYMPLTPMFHVHAWGVPYVATMLGVKQVYPGRYLPDHLLRLLAGEKVTFTHCVPTILHMLLAHPAAAQVDLSGIKMIIGGAALPRALCRAALARGMDVFAGYGMSETCPILTISHLTAKMLAEGPEAQEALRCLTGRPTALVDLGLVDEQMGAVPHDGSSTGEIVVRAPWLSQGYLKETSNSEALWRGGWLHTGDVASIDARGYVKITDRAKDVIKIAGEWVSSLELEDLLTQHPAVKEAAVISVPDEKWGERPLALVVANPDRAGEATERSLQAHVKGFVDRGLVTRHALVLRIKFVDAVEKTSVGKIDKKLLRQKHR